VVFVEGKGGYQVEVTLLDTPDVPRRLESSTCQELAGAVALILSLAVPPARVLTVEAPAPAPPPDPARLRGSLGVGLGLWSGVMPQLSAQLRVEGTLDVRRIRFVLAVVTALGAQKTSLRADAGIELQVPVMVDSRVCVKLLHGRLGLAPCLGVRGGALSATGFGLQRNAGGFAPWFGPLAALELSYDLSSMVSLKAEGHAGLQLVRPIVNIEGQGTLFQTPLGSFGSTVSVSVRL
jgi:hypothetical protein